MIIFDTRRCFIGSCVGLSNLLISIRGSIFTGGAGSSSYFVKKRSGSMSEEGAGVSGFPADDGEVPYILPVPKKSQLMFSCGKPAMMAAMKS